MNAFQYIVLILLAVLLALTVRGTTRGQMRKRIALFWILVWGVSGITLAWPQTTIMAARAVGIGRGTDLVMYCAVLAMLVGFFYVYTRFRRLDRQITLLVRKLAIDAPQLPEGDDRTG